MKNILVGSRWLMVVLGLTLASCGKGGIGNPFGSSDPFDGMPEHIRNGKTGYEKGQDTGLKEEDLPITSNQSYFLFLEGAPGESQIMGRVLREGFTYQLSIKNIEDFKGATFDPATGVFRWTPPVGIVPDTEEGVNRMVRAQIIATSLDGTQVLSKTRDFDMRIQKVSVQAAIVRDDLSIPFMREGDEKTFNVTVQYRGVANQPKGPDLRVVIDRPANTYRNDLSKYVFQEGDPVQDRNNPRNWTYKFRINLYGADLTKSASDYYFQLAFTNPLGVSSAPKEFEIPVRTNLESIRTTLDRSVIRVKPGTTFTKEAIFYDPREEGYLFAQLMNPAVVPVGMTQECREGDNVSVRICTVVWAVDPAAVVGSSVDLEFKAQSRSQAPGDNYMVERDFTMYFQVEAP